MSSKRESKAVQRTKEILRGHSAEVEELRDLANTLKKEKAFGYARKILQRACLYPDLALKPKLRTRLIQQHALCTYKDPDLSSEKENKFDRALKILEQLGDLRTATDQETLGLAGAIQKDKWDTYGQKQYLEQSLAFYRRGYQQGIESDRGYTAINAAFVFDLLANIDRQEGEKTGVIPDLVTSRQQEAQQIREEIITQLPPVTDQLEEWERWWFFVTLAEAHFGLGRDNADHYDKARARLKEAVQLPSVEEWMRESTARQLATLAHIHASDATGDARVEHSPAWRVLRDFLGAEYAAGVQGIFLGKVGLALSGGGFRASLFHIGVLARLAELDMLRHVEVLSCVSGGSIIGAHYYLEARKLLQEKEDALITKQDYIDIVKRMQKEFLLGVQRNIRVRMLADVWANLRMIRAPHTYSRTQRVGELYEEEIFSRVPDGGGAEPRYLNELLIQPAGESGDFAPKNDNWRRAAKVPMLVLNATALNTGHIWQFTATWTGEPPAGIDAEIDSNYRLRRMYYDEAPKEHHKVRLGHAVAASACVPGIFDPIVFSNLYPNLSVRLVDGGVHDNQGTASLLEQDCVVVLVSDASGQMEAQNEPSHSLLGPPLRSNTILQARVREAQYHELDARRRASLLRGVMFVHLKKDLEGESLDWVDCEDPQDPCSDAPTPGRRGVLTPYGIRRDVQQRLAAIRTDLDSFSDTEAYALMTSGYRMTEHEMREQFSSFGAAANTHERWDFLVVEDAMKQRDAAKELNQHLGVASELFLKAWRVLPRWRQIVALMLLGAPAVLGFFWACWRWASFPLLTPGVIGSTAATILVGLVVGKTVLKVALFRETLTRIALGVGVGFIMCLFAQIHLHLFDKWYLRAGHIDVKNNQPPNP